MQLIRNKVGTHFLVSSDVSLTVSTVDRFVETFRAIIAENETFIYQSTEVGDFELTLMFKLFRILKTALDAWPSYRM
jgi:hypothetical protein